MMAHMKVKKLLRGLIGMGMVAIGILHFARPEPFVRIVPRFLPAPLVLVYVSGFFEIAGGLGLLWSRTRRWAARGLIALYLAVFPANINMAINEIQLTPGGDIPSWAMWARLPLQAVIIALVWWIGHERGAASEGARERGAASEGADPASEDDD
jgi:uncharacterized membrane protein